MILAKSSPFPNTQSTNGTVISRVTEKPLVLCGSNPKGLIATPALGRRLCRLPAGATGLSLPSKHRNPSAKLGGNDFGYQKLWGRVTKDNNSFAFCIIRSHHLLFPGENIPKHVFELPLLW